MNGLLCASTCAMYKSVTLEYIIGEPLIVQLYQCKTQSFTE